MLLFIKDIVKKFDAKEVLNIPQLSISQNELVGIIGNNGAGKTTMLRLCLDLLKPESGYIQIENQNVNTTTSWKAYTSAYIDEHFLIDFLTPEEYFYFTCSLYGFSERDVNTTLTDFNLFVKNEILNQKVYIEKFSKGNKQKIGIIGAMLVRPKLLILDEPFNFLDPSSQVVMKQLLLDYNQKYGTTILLSSHNMECICDICTRLIVLEKGKIIKYYDSVDMNVKEELNDYFRLN